MKKRRRNQRNGTVAVQSDETLFALSPEEREEGQYNREQER